MKTFSILSITLFLYGAPLFVRADSLYDKTWHILGYFDGENDELERVCEYNINQLEQIDSRYAKVVVLFDRRYSQSRDSSVRIYDINQDEDRTKIISNSISIGERDMGLAEVLDEFLSKYIGARTVLIIKAHGYGIVSPPNLKIGYNSPQDPLVIGGVLKKRLDRPIDVLIFDSCNMASIEVAYEFKGLISVLVASQDLMYYSLDMNEEITYSSRPGIDYIDLVLKLTPHSDPITIGKNVVTSFTKLVSKEDAMFNKATISALDLDLLDINFFKKLSDELRGGIVHPETRKRYMRALTQTLENAGRFQPIGSNNILTHYDIQDFLNVLEDCLGKDLGRPKASVVQSYSNNFVGRASGLSILFFKDLSLVSPIERQYLFEKYSRSKFAAATGWDKLMLTYHKYMEAQ